MKSLLQETIKRIVKEEFDRYILFEAKLSDIYTKYYSDINSNIFNKLVRIDPTFNENNPEKRGKYFTWILDLYKRDKDIIYNEDYVRELLSIFDKYKLMIKNNDISKISSVDELQMIVEPFEEGNMPTSKSDEIRMMKGESKKVYEDDKWLVVVPFTEKAAIYYGKGTKWCTAATKSTNDFDEYSEYNLYINIDKQNNRKYQFCFETNELNDETNKHIKSPIVKTIGITDGLLNYYKRTRGIEYVKLFFDYCGEFINGIAVIELNDKCNFINKNEEILYGNPDDTDTWFDYCGDFNNGFAKIELDEYWNFVNENMEILYGNPDDTDTWFDDCEDFDNGFAIVQLNGKLNFINTNGEILYGDINNTDTWFDRCCNFRNGFARVVLNGKDYKVDTKGQLYDENGNPVQG